MQANVSPDPVVSVSGNLPYLRRYARALTGSQGTGDNFVAATLEAILADPGVLSGDPDAKVGLFHAFHLVWSSAGAPVGEPDTRFSAVAQGHMANLTVNTREAFCCTPSKALPNPKSRGSCRPSKTMWAI